MKKSVKIILLLVIVLLVFVELSRVISIREIDDVTPGIPCEQKYLEKSDILWVIPKYNGTKISENKTWCQEILNLNKTLGIHGFEHYYHEWRDNKTQLHLNETFEIWEECFNQTPTLFKAPNLALSWKNKKLIESNNLTIKWYTNQNIHKVYHCNDSGTLPNWLHDLI